MTLDQFIVCFGISKNPLTLNYIIIMDLYDFSLHKFLTKNFLNLRWIKKIFLLHDIAARLDYLHAVEHFVHCDLHSGNLLIKYDRNIDFIDLAIDLIMKSDYKSNKVYGSIPYIPPEVLQGNPFTIEGDIYSFGGIMYEVATGKQPFYDQPHDTYLITDICNGLRPKIPDTMLNGIPQCYLDLMKRCWSSDPSERPAAYELLDTFGNIIHGGIQQEFRVADRNREKAFKSQMISPDVSHPQSCYISRFIHTLHELHNSLGNIKSGESQGIIFIAYFNRILFFLITN